MMLFFRKIDKRELVTEDGRVYKNCSKARGLENETNIYVADWVNKWQAFV